MLKDQVLAHLTATQAPLSGQHLSTLLGVSRAAVWKAVDALRKEGYEIEGQSSVGYRLLSSPDLLDPKALTFPGQIVGKNVIYLEKVDSTNEECKRQALAGAEAGLVVIAKEQTGGKGRRGRSFQSLPGKGLYLSVLLKPNVPLDQVSQLTAWSAVAVCKAIQAVCGLEATIKWPNDVLFEGKKLCGILTELGVEAETGALSYVVVGMGTNVSQTEGDFGPELSKIATSLKILGKNISKTDLAKALICELAAMDASFPAGGKRYLEEYRKRCVTVGKTVRILKEDREILAEAYGIRSDFSLLVHYPDGTDGPISSGEVSVRGLLGYS